MQLFFRAKNHPVPRRGLLPDRMRGPRDPSRCIPNAVNRTCPPACRMCHTENCRCNSWRGKCNLPNWTPIFQIEVGPTGRFAPDFPLMNRELAKNVHLVYAYHPVRGRMAPDRQSTEIKLPPTIPMPYDPARPHDHSTIEADELRD